jgi:hypothetical protein
MRGKNIRRFWRDADLHRLDKNIFPVHSSQFSLTYSIVALVIADINILLST